MYILIEILICGSAIGLMESLVDLLYDKSIRSLIVTLFFMSNLILGGILSYQNIPIGKQIYHKLSTCPADMKPVNNVCVDIEESSVGGKVLNDINYYQCQDFCSSQGKRMLTNQEWLSACEGTPRDECNIHTSHPVIDRIKQAGEWNYKGTDCKVGNPYGPCMKDRTLID